METLLTHEFTSLDSLDSFFFELGYSSCLICWADGSSQTYIWFKWSKSTRGSWGHDAVISITRFCFKPSKPRVTVTICVKHGLSQLGFPSNLGFDAILARFGTCCQTRSDSRWSHKTIIIGTANDRKYKSTPTSLGLFLKKKKTSSSNIYQNMWI